MDLGSLLLGAVVGGATSWWISQYYYAKSAIELPRALKSFGSLEERKDTLEYFELMLDRGTWRRESAGSQPFWVCSERATFRIVMGSEFDDFEEEWTTRFPDKRARACDVELKIGESTIKTVRFVHLDGHRIVVPLTRVVVDNGTRVHFWETDSLEYKLAAIVGEYHIHESIEVVADICGVSIVRGQQRAANEH